MSTSIDRTTVVRGAGTVKLGDVQMFDKANIAAVVESEFVDDKVSGYGNIDKTLGDQLVRVSWTPSGQITPAILAALYPYGATAIDASLFGATDTAAEIHSMLGKKLTLHNSALTRMPSLNLGAQETPFGEAELTALVKNITARTAAASFYTLADVAWSGTFDKTKKIKASYTGTWDPDGTPVTIIAANGWQVDFDLNLAAQKMDDVGTYDMTFMGLTVRAKCRPVNLSEAIWDYMRMQNSASAAIGSSQRQGYDLDINADIAGAIDLTLKDAMFAEAPLSWGEDELRAGEIGFEASRDLTAGFGNMFEIALST